MIALDQLNWPEKLAIYDLTALLEDNLEEFNKFLDFLRRDFTTSSTTWARKMSFLYLLDSLVRNIDEESKQKEIHDTINEMFQTFGRLREVCNTRIANFMHVIMSICLIFISLIHS